MKTATLKISKPRSYKKTENKELRISFTVSGDAETLELYKQDQITDLGRTSTNDDGSPRFTKKPATAYKFGIENTVQRAFDEKENKYYWYVDTKADELMLAGIDSETDPTMHQMVIEMFLKRRVAMVAEIAKNDRANLDQYIAKNQKATVEPSAEDITKL
jgi:hypothetical protein